MDDFKEVQRFNQVWLWALLILLDGYIVFHLIYKPGIEVTDKFGLYFPPVIIALINILFFMLRLNTKINEEAVTAKFTLLHLKEKRFKWDEIESAYVRKYNAIKEYGGWGIKGWGFGNIAYNVSGNMGLELELKNGKRVLIGTNKPEKMNQYLEYIRSKYSIAAIREISENE